MPFRDFYYSLKPWVPRSLRLALRRIRARQLLRQHNAVWPIDERAARRPEGWPGWPEDKRFAVVLTHDVEGPFGLERVQGLMELERSLGFRSSFNFIPEGDYTVPSPLLGILQRNGFEVGIHDLRHDGKLFRSRQKFFDHARVINGYIRQWGAVGFRAGFMLRELEWYHDLEIEYDASTFDTDPFEPQPDGAGTIFPFWVPFQAATDGDAPSRGVADKTAASRRGYVELPYTLPQDSTLFLVHREPTNRIWRDKLDWVARQGGMVLLNVHPDYLEDSGGGANSPITVREHYADLLRCLQTQYAGQYWHALPRDVAAFVKNWHATRSGASFVRP